MGKWLVVLGFDDEDDAEKFVELTQRFGGVIALNRQAPPALQQYAVTVEQGPYIADGGE